MTTRPSHHTHKIFVCGIILAACAAPQPAIVDRGPVLPAEAQRIIDDATATAQVMATTNAVATQQRGATEQAAADAYTATSNAVMYSQTQSADAHTATAIVIAIESTQAAGTREALAAMRAESATQIAVSGQATQAARYDAYSARAENAAVTICIGAPSLLVVIMLWYARSMLAGLVRQQRVNGVRAVRVYGGTLLLIPDSADRVTREYIPALPAASDDEFDNDAEPTEEPDEAPIYRGGVFSGMYDRAKQANVDAQDEANRRFILRFLRDAIAVAGRDTNRLPDYRAMGYASETWQSAKRLIGERVVSSRPGRGGGTLLDCTIGELYQRVGDRKFIPRVVVDGKARPAPSQEFAEDFAQAQ